MGRKMPQSDYYEWPAHVAGARQVGELAARMNPWLMEADNEYCIFAREAPNRRGTS